jgi:hypothetical protein
VLWQEGREFYNDIDGTFALMLILLAAMANQALLQFYLVLLF